MAEAPADYAVVSCDESVNIDRNLEVCRHRTVLRIFMNELGNEGAIASVICPQDCKFASLFENVDVCFTCGLGRTKRSWAAAEQRDYLTSDKSGVKLSRSRQIFRAFISRLKPGSILDIGCSDGVLLDIAFAAKWCVLGIDPQPESSTRIIRGDFLNHQFSQQFDLLTLVHSLEHMDDPRATLLRCRSLIKPDGRLLIVVPNFGGLWSRLEGQHWKWLNPEDHRFHYTREALALLLSQSNFRIDICRTYSAFAPSLPEIMLSVKNVFGWPGVKWRPVRGGLYRLSRFAGVICNPVADLIGQGAELQVLARPV